METYDYGERQRATPTTRQTWEAHRGATGEGDATEAGIAGRGLIARPTQDALMHPAGYAVWQLDAYRFLDGDAPDTVHPNLWRQAGLNAEAGLFRVDDGLYQVRGIDISNMTFVESDSGWIVIDTLSCEETARAALAMVAEQFGERPVVAVIVTHSHADHFGGVRAVVSEDDVASGRVPLITPAGFLDAAVSENVVAGTVMGRRATYMFGLLLPRDARGHVDCGLGKGMPLLGTIGLLAPSVEISRTGEEMVIDGVRIVFQSTPETEAPAEMNFSFPDRGWLCTAENCTATMHNVYTPRGAAVRDARAWSAYVQEAIELFGGHTELIFATHHWPRWGREECLRYLREQRDAYRYLHDQTMRLANHGLTMLEIAEQVALPPSLAGVPHVRGYYGTANHNVKAVYQRYLGFFDAHPAHLHPLPPEDAGRRYVEYMGGADALLARARASFEAGDYRWVAEVLTHLVFSDPSNTAARVLQADAFEQLGYQSESGPWRDFYLTGAQELRQGPPPLGEGPFTRPGMLRAATDGMILDLVGVRLDGPEADGRVIELTVVVTPAPDRPGDPAGTAHPVGVEHGALHRGAPRPDPGPDVEGTVLRITHDALAELAGGATALGDLVGRGDAVVQGPIDPLEELLGLLDTFTMGFPIVTP